MKITLSDNGYVNHARLLRRTIEERIDAEWTTNGICISLTVDKTLPAESYRITNKTNAWQITAGDELGLYYGIGKLLHSAKWTKADFTPIATNGVVTPACSFRTMYYSIHFHNWYHEASTEELIRYTEEILLYGYNTLLCIFPVVNMENFHDETFLMFREKTRTVFKIAKELGMKTALSINSNQGLKTTPDSLLADPACYEGRTGNNGKNVCPSTPEGLAYLKELWINTLAQYTDIGIDYVLSWPYDEGGCGCEKCRPWGGNGFLNVSDALHTEMLRFYPNAKFMLSTWYFDEIYTGPKPIGEYAGLYRRLKTDMSYVDYLMVDSHNFYPRYPLEHELLKPIVNFPEISMYGLKSWGGRGANPLLCRFQKIWDSSKRVLSGGMPYSEGMYEDISKVQFAGYYWEPDKHYRDILAEYISFEYSDKVVEDVLTMMELIERNHERTRWGEEPDHDAAERADTIAIAVDKLLPGRAKNAWRWRILYIRARIDRMVYDYHRTHCQGQEGALDRLWQTPAEYLAENEEAQALLQELCRLYHTVDLERGKNHWTFPPVKDGKVLK